MALGGRDKVFGKLSSFISNVSAESEKALGSVGEFVIRKAIRRTPKDEGNLRGSFYTTHSITDRKNPKIQIGNHAKYAAVQHENLEFKHTVGEAKYLEKTIEEEMAGIKDRLLKRLKV